MKCACHSGKDYIDCCAPYLDNKVLPDTAEQLMRSRYTAYSMAKIDYIEQTMRGPAAKNFDAVSARQWAEQVDWLGLEVIHHQQKNADSASVSFIARYSCEDQVKFLAEESEFKKIAGRWYYIDGNMLKIGRNEPCPCGSCKKYKRCCYSE